MLLKRTKNNRKNKECYAGIKEQINSVFIGCETTIINENNGLLFSNNDFPISLKGGKKGSIDGKTIVYCLAYTLFTQYDTLKREIPCFLV